MNTQIICPHCNYEYNNSWEYFSDNFDTDGDYTNIECENCSKEFKCILEITYYYNCEKIENG